MTTRFIETYFKDPIKQKSLSEAEQKFIEKLKKEFSAQNRNQQPLQASSIPLNPWFSEWRMW
jgi:hypothetical protein